MPTDLGDVYHLSISIYDVNRELADATEVKLHIFLPDGTTDSVGPIASSSLGKYSYDFQTQQVGKHGYRWVATGVNASAFTGSFYVNPVDGGEFISLPQFKTHIKKTLSTDDESLRLFIGAACQVITDRMGCISPTTFTEDVDTCSGYVSLSKKPLLEVKSIYTLPGLNVVNEADLSVSSNGWYVDSVTGILYVGAVRGKYRVTYRAGLSIIPQNYILAALELTHHIWKNSQQNAGGGRPAVGIDETVVTGVSYSFPYTVRQLLGLDKRPHKGVFVG